MTSSPKFTDMAPPASLDPKPTGSDDEGRTKQGSADERDGTLAMPDPEAIAEAKESGEVVDAQNTDTRLTGARLALVVLGVCLGSLMMSLDVTIISTAIPSITSEFGDTTQIAWYPAAFTFATCAITPLAGKLAAVFPINRVYLSFMLIFLVGSCVCGWAPTNAALIAGRAIAGAGSAGVAANGMTILVKVAEPRKKPMFVGLAAGCFALGLVLAPVLGGVLTDRATWRWCFWMNLPIIAISFAVIFLFLKPPKKQRQNAASGVARIDLIGCALFIPAVFMLLFALQQGGQTYPWNSPTIIGLFVGSGLTMILFSVWEWHKGSNAMIPVEAVTRRTVSFAVGFAFFHMGSLTIATYYLPQWFQTVDGVNPLQSGIRYLPTVVTQIVMTLTASGMAVRVKYYNPWFFLAPVFLVTASALYTTFTVSSTPASHWIGYQVIQGIAGGWGMQMSSLAVQLELKDSPDLLPVGIALVSFMQYLGASVVQVIAGAVFNNELMQQLYHTADLSSAQVELLLEGGTSSVRQVAEQNFPDSLGSILTSYNAAITRVFFVPLAGACAAFLLAFGIKWTKLEGVK